MKIVAIGDSLTYGYFLNEDEKWTNKLAKKLNSDIINKGQNGDISQNLLSRFKRDATGQKADIVLIWIGVNDFFEGVSLDNVISNIKKMTELCKGENITPVVIVSTPVNANKDSFYPFGFNIEAVNSKLENMAKIFEEEKYLYIDLYKEFKSYAGDEEKLYIDDVHISKKGADLVSDIIYKYICNLLKLNK